MRSLLVRGGDPFGRLERLAARRPLRVGRYDVVLLLVRSVRRVVDVRVTGLAAEMTYYALISLIPLVTAFGSALGYLERLLGEAEVREIEDTVVAGLRRVFDQGVTTDVLAPLVRGLLQEERAGVALGSVVVALWLASRMFRAAIRALDDAYTVPERRGLLAQSALGLGLALGAVLTLVVVLAQVVAGPLLGGEQRIAEWFGQERAVDTAWGALRWPMVGAVGIGFLAVLYRYGPNVRNTWRACLPGAVGGTVGLVLVAAGFRVYLGTAGPAAPELGAPGEAVAVAAQTVGAVLAGVLWLWLSSIVILAGGVLNAELQRMREEPSVARDPSS